MDGAVSKMLRFKPVLYAPPLAVIPFTFSCSVAINPQRATNLLLS